MSKILVKKPVLGSSPACSRSRFKASRRVSSCIDIRTSSKGRSRSSVSTTARSEEHTSELQSRENLVCRLLLEKKKGKDGRGRQPHIIRGTQTGQTPSG